MQQKYRAKAKLRFCMCPTVCRRWGRVQLRPIAHWAANGHVSVEVGAKVPVSTDNVKLNITLIWVSVRKMPQNMAGQAKIGEQFTKSVKVLLQKDMVNVVPAAGSGQSEHRFLVVRTSKEADMSILGPQPLNIVFEDGEVEVIHISLEILDPKSVDLGDNVSIEMATGEIVFDYDDEDQADRRIPVSAPNTFALVGTAIMIAEADMFGFCSREKASVYRHIPGDIEGPGDMFR
jgi:hypothetical protein